MTDVATTAKTCACGCRRTINHRTPPEFATETCAKNWHRRLLGLPDLQPPTQRTVPMREAVEHDPWADVFTDGPKRAAA